MVEMSKFHRKKKEKNEDLRLFILFTSHHIIIRIYTYVALKYIFIYF